MPIFNLAKFRALAFERRVSPEQAASFLALLSRLSARATNGSLRVLSETRIEQSFNEQLFARIFGYSTLFSHGGGDYDLLPKNFTTSTNRYDDFSLGFFGPPPRSGTSRISVELKSPGIDLDAHPGPNRQTPVQQAHSGAPPSAQWVVVSNFEELRLYRKGNQTDYETVQLIDVVDPYELERAITLFSKPSLLGEDGVLSPLDRLISGGPPFMLSQRQGFIRVVHELRPVRVPDHPIPLARLEDALQHAMATMPANVWPRRPNDWCVRLRDDRLVVETIENSVPTMLIELTRTGVLRLSEYPTVHQSTPVIVAADEIACRAASFLVLGARFVGKLGLGNAELKWSLLDVAGGMITAPLTWAGNIPTTNATFPTDVPSTHTPPLPLDAAQARGELVALVVRELFFPCEMRPLVGGGSIKRLAPTPQTLETTFANSLAVPTA